MLEKIRRAGMDAQGGCLVQTYLFSWTPYSFRAFVPPWEYSVDPGTSSGACGCRGGPRAPRRWRGEHNTTLSSVLCFLAVASSGFLDPLLSPQSTHSFKKLRVSHFCLFLFSFSFFSPLNTNSWHACVPSFSVVSPGLISGVGAGSPTYFAPLAGPAVPRAFSFSALPLFITWCLVPWVSSCSWSLLSYLCRPPFLKITKWKSYYKQH